MDIIIISSTTTTTTTYVELSAPRPLIPRAIYKAQVRGMWLRRFS